MVTKKRKKKRKSLDFRSSTKDSLAFANSAVVLSIGTSVLRHVGR